MPVVLAGTLGAGAVHAADGAISECAAPAGRARAPERAENATPTERERLAESVLSACATTEIKLIRAATLDGAPVFELPASYLPHEGKAP